MDNIADVVEWLTKAINISRKPVVYALGHNLMMTWYFL
jgi:hypothetical protein